MDRLTVRKNFNFEKNTVKKKAKKRTGSFIGMLDGTVGNENYKEMKKSYRVHNILDMDIIKP